MVWLLGLLVSCAFLGVRATPIEDLVDEMIYELNQDLLDKHQDTLEIPAIDEKIEKKIFGHKFDVVEFKGEGGWFKNASTIQRTGSLTLEQGNASMALSVNLGLQDVEFGFEYYHVKLLNIGYHGKLVASIGQNSIHAHLTMSVPETGPCKTTVDQLDVQVLNKINMKLTGRGKIPDKIFSFVAERLVNGYHSKIARVVSKKLAEAAKQVLVKHEICDQFSL
ncbi:hypothetical protein GE061_004191 [Apolygus lucorum]|uniref:Lipid-binding serum glycoprotein N-terminal domain-containing protein n=1 Tax=Apolygus lucorum TaxID=248454 RepID=A0A8S9X143_APOLU|nr:hypothetical protein GE061_004191 [Apolygus lucorum]